MNTIPQEPARDDVAEADWVEQHVSADPEADEVESTGRAAVHSPTTEADTADLAEQDALAYLSDDDVENR